MRRRIEEREEKKLFRTEIVEQLVDLDPPERSKKITELTHQTFTIPYSKKSTLSRSILYKWLKEYNESPHRGTILMDKVRKDRETIRAITEAQQSALLQWRQENAYRTVEQLREELLAHETTNWPTVPSTSTIARFLQNHNCDRRTLLALAKGAPPKTRLPFESEYPQQIWQIDTKGPNIRVIDPDNPGKTIIAKPIVLLDDHSRYLVGLRHVMDETEAAVMDVIRSAIAAYGIPEIIYADLGGPYRGKGLQRALRLLGCRLHHTPPADAPAKGKVERIMQFITHHIESEIQASNKLCTLKQLSEYTAAVVSQEYHSTIHSETGETPEDRFFRFPAEYRRFISEQTLARVFLSNTTAKVSKTGMIRFSKQRYLVPNARLYRKKVVICYYLGDLSKVYVWHDDQYYGEAILYIRDNDYQRRLELQQQLAPKLTAVELPQTIPVPIYSRLDRLLAAYRREQLNSELDLNSELQQVRCSGETVKAALRGSKMEQVGSERTSISEQLWDVSAFTHLLSLLLRRQLSSSERLSIDAVWRVFGPFSEALVRKTVGELLGHSHPTSDLHSYLEALRLAALTSHREDKKP